MNINKTIPERSVYDIGQTVAFYKQLDIAVIYKRPEDLFIFEQIHDDG